MRYTSLAVCAGAILAAASPSLSAQIRRSGGSSMGAKLDAKLAEPWVRKVDWITDLEEAKAEATRSGRHIFGYFTRSYAP